MIKKYKFNDMGITKVLMIEKFFLESYRKIISEFEKDLSKYDCEIKLTRCWTVNGFSTFVNNHPPMKKYVYWIGYDIMHNGKQIVYDEENSILSRCYGVLSVSTKGSLFSKEKELCLEYSEDMSDVIEELREDLKRVKNLSKTVDT